MVTKMKEHITDNALPQTEEELQAIIAEKVREALAAMQHVGTMGHSCARCQSDPLHWIIGDGILLVCTKCGGRKHEWKLRKDCRSWITRYM